MFCSQIFEFGAWGRQQFESSEPIAVRYVEAPACPESGAEGPG